MSRQLVRRHIVVSGRVQGVGFRYRASHAAMHLNLTGWVRNDDEGTVTMELQGEEEAIYRIIPLLEKGTWIRIDDWSEKDIPVDPDERGFRVRGY
ncbi:MAG: acylphosphatase [Lachnospiraceae bacterium]|nr:acylphosphatase [Lachnospiraceae bacterium]